MWLASEKENIGPIESECRELTENRAGEFCSVRTRISLFGNAANFSKNSVNICLNFGGSPEQSGFGVNGSGHPEIGQNGRAREKL